MPKNNEKKLNKRQEAFLKAIYFEDKEAEELENLRWHQGLNKRRADVWRWLKYGVFNGIGTPLKVRLESEGLVDEGTGSSFSALERRGLILYKDAIISRIRLTRKGRKLARQLLCETPPKRLPKGTIKENQWEALSVIYEEGELTVPPLHRSGWFGGIPWNVWLRLRDYYEVGKGLVEEDSRFILRPGKESEQEYFIKMTEAGIEFYQDNWEKYTELYPEVESIPPSEKRD